MNKEIASIFSILFIITLFPHAFGEYEDTIVVMETPSGKLIFEFFPDVAPKHVENFIKLSEEGFYTGTLFHRVIEGFMIQGGDPSTKDFGVPMENWGAGGPNYSIDAEFNNIKHERGILSMARSNDPNSAGSQFFIVHKDAFFLDGDYTVFGRILTNESFQTLDKIAVQDTLNSVTGAGSDIPLQPTFGLIQNVNVVDRSELSNLLNTLENLPPKTSEDIVIQSTSGEKTTFKEYGISFDSPVGWLVQTPPVTSSTSPQIALVGSKTSSSMAAISFRVDPTTGTLDENVQTFKKSIRSLIDNGVLNINSETYTKIIDHDAYVLNAIGTFQDQDKVAQKIGFGTVLILKNNLLYNIQYTNTLQSFEPEKRNFVNVLESLEFFIPQPMSTELSSDTELQSEGGGCLIATAAFGSEMAPQVQFLREIRDNTVMNTQSGATFMTGFNQFYYSFSPYVADYQRENSVFKDAVKVTLTPMLTSLTLLNYVDIDTEEEMLGYGIGIILLNVGMYFVAPASLILVIKRIFRK